MGRVSFSTRNFQRVLIGGKVHIKKSQIGGPCFYCCKNSIPLFYKLLKRHICDNRRMSLQFQLTTYVVSIKKLHINCCLCKKVCNNKPKEFYQVWCKLHSQNTFRHQILITNSEISSSGSQYEQYKNSTNLFCINLKLEFLLIKKRLAPMSQRSRGPPSHLEHVHGDALLPEALPRHVAPPAVGRGGGCGHHSLCNLNTTSTRGYY